MLESIIQTPNSRKKTKYGILSINNSKSRRYRGEICKRSCSMEDQTDSPYLIKSYRSFETFSSYNDDSLLLVLITYGSGTLFLNGETFLLRRGSLGLFTPFDSFLLESEVNTKLQAWFVSFSLDFVVDLVSDPFIDIFTFRILREKNGIAQLSRDAIFDINEAIEELHPEPEELSIAEYLRNRNNLRFLLATSNNLSADAEPQIGRNR